MTATQVIAFVAQSVNQVIHGLRAWPSTSTRTGACIWSVSHTWLRQPSRLGEVHASGYPRHPASSTPPVPRSRSDQGRLPVLARADYESSRCATCRYQQTAGQLPVVVTAVTTQRKQWQISTLVGQRC
ncbi:hypothetical protein [Streptomyces galilaeus]|uniref:hypothetical protein n=1 Tax=Streptomyces galilaeus TaxID=33899 RepID=UPI001671C86F|nr:hypothetical protein [Streptomyces galilaeus]